MQDTVLACEVMAATWQPDENLLHHARSGACDIRSLTGPDRAWVVAALQVSGMTADESAGLLHCSLRLVRQVRAEPMCVMARYAIMLHDEMCCRAREHARDLRDRDLLLASTIARSEALRAQRDRLVMDLDALRHSMIGTPRATRAKVVVGHQVSPIAG